MSDIDPKARREVNDALINSGSAAVGQMMDAAGSSIEKCLQNQLERQRRDAKDAQDAKEKAAEVTSNTTVRPQPPYPHEGVKVRVLTVINNKRAVPPAR
ncbi:uncharacterized protein N7518_005688 [Penicillium psychrosexuale]|uniref:uncharacterized protein n=1 Tax=Penicillium psychrosexuale TaxID=1002107 RepID=UPI002545B7AE|nr:uncharacterized protein N7518_005688 [Penicillium psychrosexuale]KAJ5797148.1 hypothetical protein N7518_005688 [Penicillium psychrosexuale]